MRRAGGHPMGDFVDFVAERAGTQRSLLDDHPDVPLQGAAATDAAARLGAPPRPATPRPRTPAWRMERDAHVEPVATDLATPKLHLLVGESGFERHRVDPLLLSVEGGGDEGDGKPKT